MADNTSSPAINPSSPALPRGLMGRRGQPTGRGSRLPSIRTPRDLTLGGVQKKTFTPNIPTRRKKEEASVGQSDRSRQRREDRGKGGGRERGGRGRGRGRGRGEVIQSHSIFEQGPAEKIVKPGSYGDRESRGSGGRGGGGVGGGGGGRVGAFKREATDAEDTKKILDFILRDNFTVDEDLGGDDPLMTPIRLPVGIKKEVKEEVKPVVKAEDTPDDDVTMVDSGPAPPAGVTISSKTSVSKSITCEQLFSDPAKSEVGELIFVQLPDALPGDPPLKDTDRERPKHHQQPRAGTSVTIDPLAPTEEEKAEEEKLAQRLSQCALIDFNEGHIGKLRIHKSGRTTLLLGDVSLDVSMGAPTGFLQDLVSVKLDKDGGDMTVLGHVNHKIVCSPDFEAMLSAKR